MTQLEVQIVRFVDSSQPGWVACEFEDAYGHRHILVDKVPIFSDEMLDDASRFPGGGVVRCEVMSISEDAQKRDVLRVSTQRPDGVESTEGLSEFVVFSSQVSNT